ncbi:FAD-dependent oxidoreductase [Rhizobacter sp. Root1221]|uniref:FAD-dependent oxidoreductase n=1 Tax=Rhizobacter sp. Root1221 TaxID=1736433 RepID=UPI0006FF36CC|nr:FAD-dependent oxidoreductase [Rhizobacter sp. Root1221]KQV81297.1 FAD-dependent oxidoreductase [Rhizobacter sp. Root1221]
MARTSLGYGSDGQTIQAFEFDYRRSIDQDAAAPVRHPVVVVGGGPVGLSLAIDLAQRGQRVLLLDNDSKLSTGSRAICFAKRTLEIWDRLGVGDAMCAKGVGWNVGKVFFGNEQLYRFDLLPEPGHQRPAFINLQQYYAEAFLAVRAAELPNLEIRWKNQVVALEQDADGVRIGIDTPDGRYTIAAGHVAACDGSRSPLRALLGQESKGRTFRDRFLIADVRMQVDSLAPHRSEPGAPSSGGQRQGEATSPEAPGFPAERWFWFDPPFHPNQSVLLHRQPDGVWRIDFQLGWDADPDEEKKPEKIKPRVDAMLRQALGREVPFELEWASVYTFSCLRMDRFRLGRVLFAGDSAHGVSPFGARGANSGVQDAENLAWKLDAVLRGAAGDSLLDSYAEEREYAADENILNSTRATDFITPKSEVSRLFRDAVLQLSKHHPFARTLVNSGRLSVPATLHRSPLNTPDADRFKGHMVPGAAAADAPVRLPDQQRGWLLRQLGPGFTLVLAAGESSAALAAKLADMRLPVPLDVLTIAPSAAADSSATLADVDGLVAQRYDLQPGNAVLLRPDHHVCARWRHPDADAVRRAVTRALALH